MKQIILLSTLTLLAQPLDAVEFRTSYSSEVKLEEGQSSGELVISLPRVKFSRAEAKVSTAHSFLNTEALSSNHIQLLDYICVNGRAIIFKGHQQSVYESKVSYQSFFASGAVLDSLFRNAFQFLADNLGAPSTNARRLACSEEFLKKADRYNIKKMKDLRIDQFTLTKKGSKRKPKLIIKW